MAEYSLEKLREKGERDEALERRMIGVIDELATRVLAAG